MKEQKFGIEIEMTGITRFKAARIAKDFFENSTIERQYDFYDTFEVILPDGRKWKFMSDSSIKTFRKENGMIISANGRYSVELVSPILTYEDIPNLQELIRQLRKGGAISEAKYGCGIHIHIDGQIHTPKSLRNLVNLMASKEELIYKSLGVDENRYRTYCKKVNERLLKEINEKKPTTIEGIKDIWYKDHRGNINSHYHPSRYAGLNFHSKFTRTGTVEFRLFNGTLHAGKIRAYLVFCLTVSHQAIKQKSAQPKRTTTDNEKYTFRCWMLRLGLIGDEFKNCREHLMKNLTGNSAWRNAR